MLNPPPPVKRIIDTTMNRKTAPQKYIGFQNEKKRKLINFDCGTLRNCCKQNKIGVKNI